MIDFKTIKMALLSSFHQINPLLWFTPAKQPTFVVYKGSDYCCLKRIINHNSTNYKSVAINNKITV